MTSITITTTMDITVKIGITLPKSTIKIDNKRGDMPRSRFIRRAIERYLDSDSKNIDNIKAATKTRRK
jgi:metal-responsive CopG/Arc/MetJ family transcriptional regulator